MTDQLKRFEILVLRPLWVAVVVSTLGFVLTAHWLWLVGSVVAFFCLGIIGSKLHPLQAARELVAGPTTGVAAADGSAGLNVASCELGTNHHRDAGETRRQEDRRVPGGEGAIEEKANCGAPAAACLSSPAPTAGSTP